MRDSSSLKMIPYLNKKVLKLNIMIQLDKNMNLTNSKMLNSKNNIKNACELSDLIIIHTEWNDLN